MFFTMKLRVNIDESDIVSRTHGVHGTRGGSIAANAPRGSDFSQFASEKYVYIFKFLICILSVNQSFKQLAN